MAMMTVTRRRRMIVEYLRLPGWAPGIHFKQPPFLLLENAEME
jgi:hypothetical protein